MMKYMYLISIIEKILKYLIKKNDKKIKIEEIPTEETGRENKLTIDPAPIKIYNPRIVAKPLKYFSDRRGDPVVDTIAIHFISAINVLPEDPYNIDRIIEIYNVDEKVSAHVMFGRGGHIYRMVNPAKKAWACGYSIMPSPDNRQNVNNFSISYELIGTNKSGFTDEQYEALIWQTKTDMQKYPITNFIGHDQISGQRAKDLGVRPVKYGIKVDPGAKFNWNLYLDAVK